MAVWLVILALKAGTREGTMAVPEIMDISQTFQIRYAARSISESCTTSAKPAAEPARSISPLREAMAFFGMERIGIFSFPRRCDMSNSG